MPRLISSLSQYEFIALEQNIVNLINSYSSDNPRRVENNVPYHNDNEANLMSPLKSALGRQWTADDASRVFDRMDRLIALFHRNGTTRQYGAMLYVAVFEHLQHLKDNGDLSPNWNEYHNMVKLFREIVFEIEDFLWRQDMDLNDLYREIERSRTERDVALSEENILKGLKAMDVIDKEFEIICVVCQDLLCKEKEMIETLGCGHEYHVVCIKQWLRTKNICPLCKTKVLGGEDGITSDKTR